MRHQNLCRCYFLYRLRHIESDSQMRYKQIHFVCRIKLLVVVGIAREEYNVILALGIVAIHLIGVYEVLECSVVVNSRNLYAYVADGKVITRLNFVAVVAEIGIYRFAVTLQLLNKSL